MIIKKIVHVEKEIEVFLSYEDVKESLKVTPETHDDISYLLANAMRVIECVELDKLTDDSSSLKFVIKQALLDLVKKIDNPPQDKEVDDAN